MSAPLTQLRHLLAQPLALLEGMVMQVDGMQIHIATSQGLVIAQSATPLRVGSRVQLQNGTVVRVLTDDCSECWYV